MNKQCLSRKLLVGHLHKVAFYSPRTAPTNIAFPRLASFCSLKPCLENNLRNAPNHLGTFLLKGKIRALVLDDSYNGHKEAQDL